MMDHCESVCGEENLDSNASAWTAHAANSTVWARSEQVFTSMDADEETKTVTVEKGRRMYKL